MKIEAEKIREAAAAIFNEEAAKSGQPSEFDMAKAIVQVSKERDAFKKSSDDFEEKYLTAKEQL